MQDWMFETGADALPPTMTPDAWQGGQTDGLGLAAIAAAQTEPWSDPRFQTPTGDGQALSDANMAWMFETDFLLPATETGAGASGLTPAPVGAIDGLDPLFVPPMDEEEDPPFHLPDVVVTPNPNQTGGNPTPPPPPPQPWTPPPPPPPPPVDPSGFGGGDPGPSDPVAKDTPCVATDFESGADRAAVNNAP